MNSLNTTNSLQNAARVATPSRTGLSSQSGNPGPDITDRAEVGNTKSFDEHGFSWSDLGKGLTGAALGGVVSGVSLPLATVPLAAQTVKEGYQALWDTPLLGRTLKITVAPLVAIAGVAAIPLAVIGGVGYGLFSGFMNGVEKGPLQVPASSIEVTKEYYNNGDKFITEGMQAIANAELPTGQEPYDIRIGQGLRGAATGIVTGAMDTVAGAGLAAWYGPQVGWTVAKELAKSDATLPLKVGGEALLLPATALGVVAAPIVTGVYGLGKGVKDGYSEGFSQGISNSVSDISRAQKELQKIVDRL